MDLAQKQQIADRIAAEIKSTRTQISELEELTKPIPLDGTVGRISRMEAINNKSVNEHLLAKTKARLVKLESSRSFIEKEDYGNCRACKQPIPLGRLMMLPETDKCVECA
ncbi:MAG: TraR/DksA C4-type zinc finger protein [Candidatus Marinimicrobia bacterium]|nr:TraR/DksA C4-type zinc finger protein [Candidatus Neomarinimicrobiota bacterium]